MTPRHKVLIVEDEQDIAGLIKHALERGGDAEAEIVASGDAALRAAAERTPDLIILDLNLPDINGIDVLREIRSVEPHTPVIILTGAGRGEVENQARELGVTDFLQKGFSLHELGAALNRVLKQPGQADPPSSGPKTPRAR